MTASGPVVVDGVVYCGGDTEALALRAADGKALWRTPRSNHARPGKYIFPSPPAVVTRDLFVVAMTGANRNTVKVHLKRLVQKRRLILEGTGKGAWYRT
jgi:hypothetical protein